MGHASGQAQRWQKPLERAIQASSTTLEAMVRRAARPEYCCHADAEAAAATLRALQRSSHGVQVEVEERPKDGPGRPHRKQPRVVKALRYGLRVTRHERAEVMARKVHEAGCYVLLTSGPPEGEMAYRASEVLRASKAQHGGEQHVACLQAPIMVNRLVLKKPARIDALGLIVWLALLLWRLVERALRVHVETAGSTLPGWDNRETQKPMAFMRMIKFAAVMVIKGGGQRQLAPPTVDDPTAIPSGAAGPYHLLQSTPEAITRRGRSSQEPKAPWLIEANGSRRGGQAVARQAGAWRHALTAPRGGAASLCR